VAKSTDQELHFRDRADAGRRLSERLAAYRAEKPLVVALARGGVVVGEEVARALGAPLEVMVARKLGAPGQPELGVGAIAPGVRVVDERAVRELGISARQLEWIVAAETEEMERRLRRYRGDRGELDVRDRTVILVDDGLATGVTARAAIHALRRQRPRRLVFAAPVCAPDTARLLGSEADEVVCVAAPVHFGAVGSWYADFAQTSDDEVLKILSRAPREEPRRTPPSPVDGLVEACRGLARPLEGLADLDPLMEQIGDARYVLLGEATHGTSEYYLWRARISRRLIEEKGFSFIAVEGDWPDCFQVNRYVKGRASVGQDAPSVLRDFARWPTWMWANWEVAALAEWLRRHNATRPMQSPVGFYGLDVYSLWESLEAVVRYLGRVDGHALEAARRAYECFEPSRQGRGGYPSASVSLVPASCEQEVLGMLTALRQSAPQDGADDLEAHFAAEQNALVVRDAETYYRAMLRGGEASWNVRDRHMVDTLERLMRFHGPEARAIVWEHNTHVGDARATDMAQAGMVNVGQLARERHAKQGVVLVGFASHRGSVIAGSEWEAPMQRMPVPPARPGSWEDVLHRTGRERALFMLNDEAARADAFMDTRPHRAIGVVYDPRHEHGNYVPTVLPRRYDALIFLDETHALHPLELDPRRNGDPPETYPWGV
jgi:erythromycin esterase-like protein/predicted phosphoribosyltransferase